ncbi:MAG: hypothetical protein MUF24_14350 [Chitinophagaceae bacterium]|jgi:hypothetical protein|nr:hypothetical protein [Chitinophagaceae bacterium]
MKFLATLVLVVLFTFLAYLYADHLPWWSFVPGAILAGALVPQAAWKNALAGFLGVAVVWFYTAWDLSSQNGHLLANKIAQLIPGGASPYALMAVASLVGGILGAMAATTGTFMRSSRQ